MFSCFRNAVKPAAVGGASNKNVHVDMEKNLFIFTVGASSVCFKKQFGGWVPIFVNNSLHVFDTILENGLETFMEIAKKMLMKNSIYKNEPVAITQEEWRVIYMSDEDVRYLVQISKNA